MPDTDIHLLVSISRHDQHDGWSELVAVYRPLLKKWVRKLVPQDADEDDVVQEILTVVITKLPQFCHNGAKGQFRSWLRSILANKVLEFWRHHFRQVPVNDSRGALLAEFSKESSEIQRQWDHEHDQRILQLLLQKIRGEFNEKSWQAFQLYSVEGHGPATVAERLGMSKNAVFIAHSRILQRLREVSKGLLDLE